MNDLIARVLSGEANEPDARQLDEWRRASPDNERTYQASARAWEVSARVETVDATPRLASLHRIVAEAERRRARRLRWTRGRPMYWAAAAAAVVVLGVGVMRLAARPEFVVETVAGQTLTVPLADGSVVKLGPQSRLEVWGSDQRSVNLAGTAFFAVATDSSRRFLVGTERGDAEVLGTRFELRAVADSLRLVVVEGRVALSAGRTTVEVGQGKVSRIVGSAPPSQPETADVWGLLDWPDGLLVFQATPLARVLEEVGAHFATRFVIRDSVLARRSVTAWFEDELFEEVVTTICLVVDARCTLGDTVEVAR